MSHAVEILSISALARKKKINQSKDHCFSPFWLLICKCWIFMFTPGIKMYYFPMCASFPNLIFRNELLSASFSKSEHHFLANYCKLQVQRAAFWEKIMGWMLQTGKLYCSISPEETCSNCSVHGSLTAWNVSEPDLMLQTTEKSKEQLESSACCQGGHSGKLRPSI